MKLLYPLKTDEKVITQHFGKNPEEYSKYKIGGVPLKGHDGLDLRAPMGTEVVACDSGFAQEVMDQGTIGYGKYIKIIHSWGESVYAHLQEFKIKQGNEVKAGQVIGKADNTGNSTGSHLHIGIRINPYNRADGWGGYSDPEPYLFGEVSDELDMPIWAKNLQPFFIENGLKDDQIEGAVRESFENKRILQGLISKWVQKFQLKEEEADLGHIEEQMEKLLDIEDAHQELLSAIEQLVGHFETEKALRDAIRAHRVDVEEMSKLLKNLQEEREILLKKKVLDRFEVLELVWGAIKKLWEKIKEKIRGIFKFKK